MATRNTKLLWRDSFLCTVLTLVVSGIFLLIFVNLSVLDPFYRAFKDFSFTDIYYSTLINDEAVFNFAFCHIFPARASNVIAIIRIDQIIGFELSAPSRSRNKAGAIRRNSADAPKTIEPALSVFLIPC